MRRRPRVPSKRKIDIIRRTKLALGIPTTLRDWRGFAAEDKAEKALRYLKRKKLIEGYRRTRRFSFEDLEGQDFIVELLNGKTITIDVKNYRCHQEKEREIREKGNWLLVIWPGDTDEVAREKTLAVVVSAYLSGLSIEKVRALISGVIKGVPEKPKKGFGLPRALLSLIKKIQK